MQRGELTLHGNVAFVVPQRIPDPNYVSLAMACEGGFSSGLGAPNFMTLGLLLRAGVQHGHRAGSVYHIQDFAPLEEHCDLLDR